MVGRAIDFLRRMQCENGAWWGRWKVCYVAETATILLGLASIGEDMSAEYVRRALGFLASSQNDDGGFGEVPEAYENPTLAGHGPSMPAVTAYVMLGVLAARGTSDATMAKAAAYLIRQQRPDGLWNNERWLHTFIPPHLLYEYVMPAHTLPVVALRRFVQCAAI